MEWQDISTAKEYVSYIVCDGGIVGEAMQYQRGVWWWANAYEIDYFEPIHPTHYIPLPAPPTDKAVDHAEAQNKQGQSEL